MSSYFCNRCQRTMSVVARDDGLYWFCSQCDNVAGKIEEGHVFYTNEKTYSKDNHDLRQDNLSQYVVFGCPKNPEHKFARFRPDVGFQCCEC